MAGRSTLDCMDIEFLAAFKKSWLAHQWRWSDLQFAIRIWVDGRKGNGSGSN
jgi:hypothetical protein